MKRPRPPAVSARRDRSAAGRRGGSRFTSGRNGPPPSSTPVRRISSSPLCRNHVDRKGHTFGRRASCGWRARV